MKASVVVVSSGRVELLNKTLHCLAKQTIEAEYYEVIVVGGGSLEHSEWIAQAPIQIRVSSTVSTCVATLKNEGIQLAQYPLCIFIQEGMLVPSSVIEEAIRYHERQPNAAGIGYIHGMQQSVNHPFIRVLRQMSNANAQSIFAHPMLVTYGDRRCSQFQSATNGLHGAESFKWMLVHTALFTIETEVIRRIGGMDARFFGQGMGDAELGYRLFQEGVHLDICKQVRGLLLPGEGQVTSGGSPEDYRLFWNKYPSFRVELFCVSTQHYFISMYKHFTNEAPKVVSAYPGLEQLLPEANGTHTLIVGCMSAQLSDRFRSADCYAPIEGLQGARVMERIGLYNDCRDQQYEVAIVTDIWKVIPVSLYPLLFDELFRISKKVFVIDTHAIHIHDSLLPTTRSHHIANTYTLIQAAANDEYTVLELKENNK